MKLTMILLGLLALSAILAANVIPYDNQIQLLMSARQADLQDYYTYTGVVLTDAPALDPHFACLRVALAAKYGHPWASTTDRLACLPYSHASRVQAAIKEFPTNPNDAIMNIQDNIADNIPIVDDVTQQLNDIPVGAFVISNRSG